MPGRLSKRGGGRKKNKGASGLGKALWVRTLYAMKQPGTLSVFTRWIVSTQVGMWFLFTFWIGDINSVIKRNNGLRPENHDIPTCKWSASWNAILQACSCARTSNVSGAHRGMHEHFPGWTRRRWAQMAWSPYWTTKIWFVIVPHFTVSLNSGSPPDLKDDFLETSKLARRNFTGHVNNSPWAMI